MTTSIAVIGCGFWGRNLVRNFAELGALAAVCDADAARAAQYAQQYDAAHLTLEAVAAAPDIDGVVIATPAVTHAALAIRMLRAGKHVFVEKPLALTVAEAGEVRDVARETGLTLMVGHLLQYHPVFLRLKALIGDGALGRIQHIYSHRLNLGKVRREENILWSFAPHDISMILSLIGTEPDSVSAIGSNYLHKSIADVTTTHMTFPGGENAHVFVSWLNPYKEQRLVITGDKAMAVFDDTSAWEDKLLLYPHRIEWKDGVPVPDKADAERVPVEQGEPLRAEAAHFIDCVAGRTQCRTDGDEAIRVLRVLEAAERAMSEQRSVSVRHAQPAPGDHGALIHDTAVVDQPATIGSGTRVWHFAHVLRNSVIGTDCVLGQNVCVGPDVTIGDRCKLQNNVSIYRGVTLEDGVFCGPSCVFTNVMTPRAEVERKDEFLPTLVRRGATIGANATILCGITLGRYCLVGAGAVVTRDVPDHALVTGTPAVLRGWVSRSGDKLDLPVSGDGEARCPRTGERYRLSDGTCQLIEET